MYCVQMKNKYPKAKLFLNFFVLLKRIIGRLSCFPWATLWVVPVELISLIATLPSVKCETEHLEKLLERIREHGLVHVLLLIGTYFWSRES